MRIIQLSLSAIQKFSNSLFTRYKVKSPNSEFPFFLPRVGEIPGDWSNMFCGFFALPRASKLPPPRPNSPTFCTLSSNVGLILIPYMMSPRLIFSGWAPDAADPFALARMPNSATGDVARGGVCSPGFCSLSVVGYIRSPRARLELSDVAFT
jgi:hypothetical protein